MANSNAVPSSRGQAGARSTKASKRAGRAVEARTSAREQHRETVAAALDDPTLSLLHQLNPGFPLTHLEKVLYPEEGLRKADLVAYYTALADWMLPHVARRPLVLLRCPEGRKKSCFFQKHVNTSVPDVVARATISEARGDGVYGFVEDVRGLLALAQLGVLELHTWGCHVDDSERPDLLVFDLDPAPDLDFERVRAAALGLRELLARLGLECFVKTTGGKGLHVVAPVKAEHGWPEHKAFARAVVSGLMKDEPERYVINMRKQAREGKIYLDYLRNARGASAIAPYSPRARKGALIATPLRWTELESGARPEQFDMRGVVRRLEADPSDPWHGFFALSQTLPSPDLQRNLALI